MPFFVGVEGVNLRQSVAVAADATGRVLSSARIQGKSISYLITDQAHFCPRLVELLQQLMRKLNLSIDDMRDAIVCIGLNGIGSLYELEVDIPRLLTLCELRFAKLICTGDSEITLASHAHSANGTAILAHIGSVALVRSGNRFVRLGGWGPTFADEGSGYWIGRRALRTIGLEVENDDPPSALWRSIDEWLLGCHDSTEVPDWRAASITWRQLREHYSSRRYDPRFALIHFARTLSLQTDWRWRLIASSLVIPVMRAWRNGDDAAKHIVRSAALDLARLYKRACTQSGLSANRDLLVLYGGILNHNADFRELLITMLREDRLAPPEILTNDSPGAMRPACGALLFAIGDSTTQSLKMPPRVVIDTVVASHSLVPHDRDLAND